MSKFKVQFSLLKYTGLFFVFLTALTLSTLLTPPTNLSLAKSVDEDTRQPSSIFSIHTFSNKAEVIKQPVEPEFYSYSIKCENLNDSSEPKIQSKGKNIRFKTNCIESNEWLSVTNLSNQHSGNFIKVDSHNLLTSDFIRLSKGQNNMKLVFKNQDGEISSKLFTVTF